jgi:hypothetical protein
MTRNTRSPGHDQCAPIQMTSALQRTLCKPGRPSSGRRREGHMERPPPLARKSPRVASGSSELLNHVGRRGDGFLLPPGFLDDWMMPTGKCSCSARRLRESRSGKRCSPLTKPTCWPLRRSDRFRLRVRKVPRPAGSEVRTTSAPAGRRSIAAATQLDGVKHDPQIKTCPGLRHQGRGDRLWCKVSLLPSGRAFENNAHEPTRRGEHTHRFSGCPDCGPSTPTPFH